VQDQSADKPPYSGRVRKEELLMSDERSEWVLVVDDDIQNLKVASRILSARGIKVSCLASGSDAVNFLAENKPDLVLLDVHMPEMDGFETMRLLQENSGTAKIPVILLTADEDSETEARGLRSGARDFIKKPFVPEVLVLRTQNIIELERYRAKYAADAPAIV